MQRSYQTGVQLFGVLASGGGQSNATSLQNQINQTRVDASAQLGDCLLYTSRCV